MAKAQFDAAAVSYAVRDMDGKPGNPENALQSIAGAITLSPDDWSADGYLAWIYGIVVGWGDALEGVAERHQWGPEQVARLRRLHENYQMWCRFDFSESIQYDRQP